MDPLEPIKQLQVVSDQLKSALAQAVRTQDGAPVAGYHEQLGKAVEELEKAKADLAKSLVPPPKPPEPPVVAVPTPDTSDLMTRAAAARKRAEEIEAARTRKPLDGPPVPFQGDEGLDAKKIQSLIHSLLHPTTEKSEREGLESSHDIWEEDWKDWEKEPK